MCGNVHRERETRVRPLSKVKPTTKFLYQSWRYVLYFTAVFCLYSNKSLFSKLSAVDRSTSDTSFVFNTISNVGIMYYCGAFALPQCSGNTTVRYVSVVLELNVTVKRKNTECCTTVLLWWIYVSGNNANHAYQLLKEIILQLICTLFKRYI
jgi:hypothetical protein